MKFGIIGSGCGGLFLSILLKQKNKDIDVIVIDKNKINGRKLYVTGNGRCNLTNLNLSEFAYNNKLAFNCLKEFNQNDFKKFLLSIGVLTKEINELVYPYSLSAKSFTDYLISYAKKLEVKFINECKVNDYKVDNKKIILQTNKGDLSFDKIFISSGGKSGKNLGSDGSFFEILLKHKYLISEIKPGLAPIYTEEKTNLVANERIKVNSRLIVNKKVIYKEDGEIIFKKDGLSGICIFNISSLIARQNIKKPIVEFDLMPDVNEQELLNLLTKCYKQSKENLLDGVFTDKMSKFILLRFNQCFKHINNNNISNLVYLIKHFTFTYKGTYPFEDSQVSVGGLELSEINNNFESKKEKNVYFLGEVLNLDGLCGGFNIQLCFSEARKIVNELS